MPLVRVEGRPAVDTGEPQPCKASPKPPRAGKGAPGHGPFSALMAPALSRWLSVTSLDGCSQSPEQKHKFVITDQEEKGETEWGAPR